MHDPFTLSPELAAIAKRWLVNYSTRQSAAAANLFSHSDAVTYIGSDAGELLTGAELRDTFKAFSEVQAKLIPEDIVATAYEAGSFGWAHTSLTIHSPDADKRVPFRNTFVFSLEDGVWRIVHVQNSNPKPNMEAMGYESGNPDELVAAAQSARLDMLQTGIASVMFTDIVDSTALASAMGDTAWSKVVKDHLAQITQAVSGAGGQLVKTLGDGTLSTFSSASGAMKTAQAIHRTLRDLETEPRLRIRIGIHTGDVVESDGDFMGGVVNKAARVAAMATPDEIRVSEATRVMVGTAPGFAFSDPVHVPLKGLEGEHLIHRLEW